MPEPEIIYTDKNFLAVNKPAGWLTHAAKRDDLHPTGVKILADWLAARYPEIKKVGNDPAWRPGIVHRLDQGTSGVLLIARTQIYFEYLTKLFREHQIKKTYLAVVYGRVAETHGIINKPIGIKSGSMKRSVHATKMLKESITEYEVVKYLKNQSGEIYTLLEVQPKTGRTHQIRVHLASLGHPIVGDALYGRKPKLAGPTRLRLHALSLEFSSSPGERLKLEAPAPADFYSLI